MEQQTGPNSLEFSKLEPKKSTELPKLIFRRMLKICCKITGKETSFISPLTADQICIHLRIMTYSGHANFMQ